MSNPRASWTLIPVVVIVVAIGLLAVATLRYAGGSDWGRVTVSMLCAASLPDGEPNAGRALPIIGLMLLCVSFAWMFEMVSRGAESRRLGKVIQISGIGAMVYALLTATPMHDVMVNVALAFFFVAMVSILCMLVRSDRIALAIAGATCLLFKFVSAAFYYANVQVELWGILQKVSFLLTTAWLCTVYLQSEDRHESRQASLLRND